jgi:hypothetical protein
MSVYELERNIFIKYPNPVFVETGTFKGNSVKLALEAGFKKVYSIELSDKYFNYSFNRFKDDKNVFIFQGDSSMILWDVIEQIREPITFWLDGHYSKDDTAIGRFCVPLIQELEQIRKHYINTHTIMIDDMRCWVKPKKNKQVCPNCKLYPCGKYYGFYKGDIITKLLSINPIYQFSYEDGYIENDILIAKI